QGLGRYGIEDAENPDMGSGVGYIPNTKFEWYLKNHLGSTMLVYGTQADANPAHSDIGTPLAAYDYRAFGEMIELTPPPTGKVTENFTGKEHDDEIALDYFGARYLDPMLGMWISVDPARQFASPYLYAGNGMNPVNVVDPDGNAAYIVIKGNNVTATVPVTFQGDAASDKNIQRYKKEVLENLNGQFGRYNLTVKIVDFNPEIHKAKMNNVINLTNSPNYGVCRTSHSCVPPSFNEAYVYLEKGTHTRVHEFAHLLGLDDKYNNVYMDFENQGKPFKGYDDSNLMVKGLKLNESQIEEMWSPGPIYPEYGYEHNELRIEKGE
ncbi:MAG: RHS repeat-associated core domain-containing protein, partial [Fibrobacter sp.]|nr:RHS repeat-associated core domain-containing protein [Fibrobacter sp.]